MRSKTGGGTGRHRPGRTFVSLTGPEGNIGDALIRRETLRWALGTSDALVVYTGAGSDVWLRQLGVPASATVLRSKRNVPRWLWMLATAPARPVLVFEAGEVPLNKGNGLREFIFLVETVLVRLKRGVVVRPPRGIRAASNPSTWLHARAARLSQLALWRDASSAAIVGGGAVVPDIGFATRVHRVKPAGVRDELVVSLRGHRAIPNTDWVDAVRATANEAGLRLRTVVQVREDEARARELAEALGAQFDPWGDTDSVIHEQNLRERYSRARLVISDRMHVLVLAAVDGAAPAELVPAPSGKITAAFATVGIHDISLDASQVGPAEMRAFLEAQMARSAAIGERVEAARQRLDVIEQQARETIRINRA